MLPMRKPAFTDEPELTPLSERLARVQFDENGEAEIIVDREGMDEILSALKTVRGIEAAKRILIEWDEEVKIWRVNTFTSEGWQSGKTVFLAVDAAVGASERGGK